MNKYTPSFKIEMARYFLKHLDETQASVSKRFGVSRNTLSSAINYYLRMANKKLKPMNCTSIDGMDMHRDDSKGFEKLIGHE